MNAFTRRSILAVGMGLPIAALSACGGVTVGNPQVGEQSDRADKDSYRVAYIARAQVDTFAAWLANEMKEEVKNFPDLELEVFDGQAQDDVENKMIENAIANKFDAIIVQPNNGEAQKPYVQNAVNAGIIVITTNPKIDGIEGASTVDSDPFSQGADVAALGLDMIPQGAQVVVLNGPGGNFHSTERRRAWQEEFFDKRPDVVIVAENIANWNKDEALKLMENWSLAHPQIDAIISMNDNMAAGALEAVKGKAGFEQILSYGVDGTPEAVQMIAAGTMTATALQNAQELAKLNVESVHALLKGETESVEESIGNPVITQENAQEYIDMYTEAGLI